MLLLCLDIDFADIYMSFTNIHIDFAVLYASTTVSTVTAPTIHKIPTTSIIPNACPSTVAERIVATNGSTHPSILPWTGPNMEIP